MFNFECFALLKWDISCLFIFFLSFQNDLYVILIEMTYFHNIPTVCNTSMERSDRKLNMDMFIILLFKP